MGLAMIAVRAIETFTRPGLAQTLIARQQSFDEAKGTAFTLLVGRGVLLSVALAVAAPWIARFYEADQLEALTRAEAEGFYHVHRERPFFASLCGFMSSGPCITMVLEREGAIAELRETMGATDPAKAAAGTLRKDFASWIEANAIHGSDSPETGRFEIGYFFPGVELV